MPKDSSFHDYVLYDLFEGIPNIRSTRMFGGYGFYKDNIFFALIFDDQLYFKVDDENKGDYEEYSSEPFVYEKKGDREIILSYWLVPEEIMENRDRLYEWVEKAVDAGERVKKKKK